MKIQMKDKQKFFIFFALVLSILFFSIFNKTFAMKHYQEVDFKTGLVTAKVLNVRQGPAFSYKVISKVYKDQYIRIFAKINNWYVIQTENDIIGVVHEDYIKPIYPKSENQETTETSVNATNEVKPEKTEEVANLNDVKETENLNVVVSQKENTSELVKEEQEILDLINQKREEAGLNKLKIDDDLQNVCRIKAEEMVEKEYFSHTSPKFGTPFEMLKKEGIEYKVAGENIAGNSDNEKAVEAWMNSENHKSNILNKAYNYTGVAVVDSKKYGKIYVQMFIGR